MEVAELAEALKAAAAGDWRQALTLGHRLELVVVPALMHAAVEQGRAEGATETEMADLLEVTWQAAGKRFPPAGGRVVSRSSPAP